jgi:hypothetical protein
MVLCIAQVKNWCYLVRLEALICQISCPKLSSSSIAAIFFLAVT